MTKIKSSRSSGSTSGGGEVEKKELSSGTVSYFIMYIHDISNITFLLHALFVLYSTFTCLLSKDYFKFMSHKLSAEVLCIPMTVPSFTVFP